jgi:hypothetical protein
MENMLDISSIINDNRKFEKTTNTTNTTYTSVQAFEDKHEIGRYKYVIEFVLKEQCNIYKTKANQKELIVSSHCYSSDIIKDLSLWKKEDLIDKVSIYKVSLLENFFNDLNIKQYSYITDLLKEDLKKYEFSIKSNLEVIFNGAENFKKSISLEDSDFNYAKYSINNKTIVAYNNGARGQPLLIIYENDDNKNIRVLCEYGDKIDKLFNKKDKCYSKYSDIVKYCLENSPVSIVIKDDEVKILDEPYQILEAYHAAKALIRKFKLVKKVQYNKENLKELLQYSIYPSINALLTHGMWSVNGIWNINENNEYYFEFKDDDMNDIINDISYDQKLQFRYETNESINAVKNKSIMKTLPNGIIKQDWLNLIIDSYVYYINNNNNFKVNSVKSNDIKRVEKYLKTNRYIK